MSTSEHEDPSEETVREYELTVKAHHSAGHLWAQQLVDAPDGVELDARTRALVARPESFVAAAGTVAHVLYIDWSESDDPPNEAQCVGDLLDRLSGLATNPSVDPVLAASEAWVTLLVQSMMADWPTVTQYANEIKTDHRSPRGLRNWLRRDGR